MRGWRRVVVVVGVAGVALIGTSACSSDSSTSDNTATSADTTPDGTTEADATWCTSVENLVEQSSGGGVTVSAVLPALSQALVSLSATAPEAISSDVQTLATLSQAAVEVSQTSPGATLPPDAQQQATDSWAAMQSWVDDNCGVTLPPLQP